MYTRDLGPGVGQGFSDQQTRWLYVPTLMPVALMVAACSFTYSRSLQQHTASSQNIHLANKERQPGNPLQATDGNDDSHPHATCSTPHCLVGCAVSYMSSPLYAAHTACNPAYL